MRFLAILFAYLTKEWKQETSYRLSAILQISGVVGELATFFFIDRLFSHRMADSLLPYGTSYFGYVVVGVICFSYAGVGVDGLPRQLAKEQNQGTLEALLVTPAPLWTLLSSMAMWNTLWATLDVALYVAAAKFLFGLSLPAVNWLSVGAVGVLTVITLNVLGVIDAAVVLVFKRGQISSQILGALWGLLGGVYFPITVLPGWLQSIAWLLPTTYSVKAMQLAVHQGSSIGALLPLLIPLLLMGVGFLGLGSWAFQKALRAAKMRGSLSYP